MDAEIEAEDTDARFILAGPETPVADHELRLAALRESWDLSSQRQHVDDATWHSDLAQYLTHLVDLRVAHVESWIESNIQQFEGGHASIEELRRTFGSVIIDLRASVELCRSKCGSCNLVCVRSSRLHGDGHDCLTSHKCIHNCSFCERDALPTQPCGQSYVTSVFVMGAPFLTASRGTVSQCRPFRRSHVSLKFVYQRGFSRINSPQMPRRLSLMRRDMLPLRKARLCGQVC